MRTNGRNDTCKELQVTDITAGIKD